MKEADLRAAMERRAKTHPGKPRRRRPTPVKRPESLRMEYQREITSRLEAVFDRVRREIFPALQAAEGRMRELRPDSADIRTDGWADDIDRAIEIVERYAGTLFEDADEIAIEVARMISRYNYQAIVRQVQVALGVEILIPEPYLPDELASFARENARLIKTIPERFFSDIEGIAQREFRAGKGAQEVGRMISERFGVTRRQAAVIARDQVGKLNGQLSELRYRTLGVEEYIWRTTGQEDRMRPHHAEREGRRYRMDDPPDDGHPGQAIQCMCWMEPVFPEVPTAEPQTAET